MKNHPSKIDFESINKIITDFMIKENSYERLNCIELHNLFFEHSNAIENKEFI